MTINTYIPSDRLKPFIKSYLIIESQGELVNRVLPDTSLVIAFRFKGHVNYVINDSRNSLPIAVISGLRKSARLINYTTDTANLLVIFNETGASAFFKEPLNELYDETVALDNFITQQTISIIEEQLAGAQNNNQRIAIIEQFLLSKVYNSTPDKLIASALQKIHSTKGYIKIKELAHTLYISQDAFEKRFRKIVGTSPKQFSSVVRMQSIIKNKTQHEPLINLALDAGYFDQPHFNKDFKLFTGQTPTEFFKSLPLW